MKNIKNILETLDIYYTTTRQVGHSTAMIEGIKNTDKCIVISHNMDMGNMLKELIDVTPRTVTSLINKHLHTDRSYLPLTVLSTHLKGTKKPLFIDNAALQEIFQQAHTRITELENIIENAKKEDLKIEEFNKEISEILYKVKETNKAIEEPYITNCQKPPLGLRPRKISDQARIVEICEAIARYAKSGLDIPTEWIDELNDITEYYCDSDDCVEDI